MLIAQLWQTLMKNHSFICQPHIYPQVEWAIPVFTPQPQCHRTWALNISRPCDGVGGWVGPGDWWNTEVVCPPEDGHCIVVAAAAENRTQDLESKVQRSDNHTCRLPMECWWKMLFPTQHTIQQATCNRESRHEIQFSTKQQTIDEITA